ncbi:hypothetical protein BT96DRAFT_948681 [Gymnopus androsaceus JB14]|uniref:Uncharacterized protein n=1 Tax=Gymnopus androsaceus JB14 TaxID=1447944 RepID=A0A6A4GN71_9AGAR|nr:hypothetical protein BT96DRAFT_948681 [Gymnopus androsaceus JB14]
MQMLEDTKIEQLVDRRSLRAFARQFDASCLKITGKSFVDLWKHRIASVVEDHNDLSSVDGQEIYLFLQLLRVPGNQASVFLDKASIAMDYSGQLWALLMDLEIRVVGWGTATRAAVITLRELVQSVHSYKAYHAVSRRVKGNLIQCAKLVERKLSVASLRLRAGRDDVALQEAWDQLKREFYITDAFDMVIQCANTTTDILSVRPPCRQHYEAIHWQHPIYGQPHGEHIIPSIDLAYIQDMASVAIQIARDHGDLSDMVLRAKRDISARLVVIFDLSKPTLGEYEIMSQEDALEDEEMVDKERMELMIMDTNVSFCGRVPLCRDSRTLVVCMDRQFVRDDGTIMDREDVVQSFRRMWSQEYSKQISIFCHNKYWDQRASEWCESLKNSSDYLWMRLTLQEDYIKLIDTDNTVCNSSAGVICPWWEIGGSAVNYYDDWQATLPPYIHSKSPTQVEAYGLPGRLRRSSVRRGQDARPRYQMRMIVTRLMFIRCPTFTPVGETLALSPTLANFASVLPILPENILVLLPLHPRKQCTSPSCPINSDPLRSSWAEPEDPVLAVIKKLIFFSTPNTTLCSLPLLVEGALSTSKTISSRLSVDHDVFLQKLGSHCESYAPGPVRSYLPQRSSVLSAAVAEGLVGAAGCYYSSHTWEVSEEVLFTEAPEDEKLVELKTNIGDTRYGSQAHYWHGMHGWDDGQEVTGDTVFIKPSVVKHLSSHSFNTNPLVASLLVQYTTAASRHQSQEYLYGEEIELLSSSDPAKSDVWSWRELQSLVSPIEEDEGYFGSDDGCEIEEDKEEAEDGDSAPTYSYSIRALAYVIAADSDNDDTDSEDEDYMLVTWKIMISMATMLISQSRGGSSELISKILGSHIVLLFLVAISQMDPDLQELAAALEASLARAEFRDNMIQSGWVDKRGLKEYGRCSDEVKTDRALKAEAVQKALKPIFDGLETCLFRRRYERVVAKSKNEPPPFRIYPPLTNWKTVLLNGLNASGCQRWPSYRPPLGPAGPPILLDMTCPDDHCSFIERLFGEIPREIPPPKE